MRNYFLISEFAKLRGININSLRYYEKLGILKPAYVDENTNYRYYSVEQISLLNKIILCIQLGISLKEMATYIDENGELQSQKLLERGRVIAQKRIQEMENNLKYIENSLKSIEVNKEFAGKKGKYIRKMEERRVIITDFCEGSPDIKKNVSEISEIYKIAQKNDLYPILPAGQIIELDASGKIRIRFFLEILNYKKESGIDEKIFEKKAKIETIPAGEYTCVQVELGQEIDLEKIVRKHWGKEEKITIIMDNVMEEKYSFGKSLSEMKRYVEKQLEKHDWYVDYVFSHTVPVSYEPVWAFLPGIDQSKVDKSMEYWLQDIANVLDFEMWYAGHYHVESKEGQVRIMYEDYEELE